MTKIRNWFHTLPAAYKETTIMGSIAVLINLAVVASRFAGPAGFSFVSRGETWEWLPIILVSLSCVILMSIVAYFFGIRKWLCIATPLGLSGIVCYSAIIHIVPSALHALLLSFGGLVLYIASTSIVSWTTKKEMKAYIEEKGGGRAKEMLPMFIFIFSSIAYYLVTMMYLLNVGVLP